MGCAQMDRRSAHRHGWHVGTLARWHVGTLARWHVGTLARWRIGGSPRVAVARIVLVSAFLLFLNGCGGPPQIGSDDKCFKAVDALYTAITAHEPGLLAQCAKE